MKKRYIVTAVFFILAVFTTLLLFLTRSRYSDFRADSFGKDYARISVFSKEEFHFDRVNSTRVQVDSRLLADSHTANGRLWYDSYVRFGEAFVEKYDGSSSFKSNSISVGGDFFLLHDFEFLSGDRFYSDDNYKDRVVIDERAAFKLFGSTNCIGMPLVIDSEIWYVSGVVRAEESEAWELQFGFFPFVIMPDDYLSGNSYSVYEIVLPDPVEGYAVGVVSESVGEDFLVVDVTNRYSFSNMFENLADFSHRSYVTSPIAFPWFENIERGRLDTLSLMLLSWLISLSALSMCVIYVIIRRKK